METSTLRFCNVKGNPTGSNSVAGISSDSIASVLVHQAKSLLKIAVSDPTQANNGTIHIEIATPAGAVVSQDDGITVEQTTPTVRLSISAGGSQGKPFLVTLTNNPSPLSSQE